MPAQVFDFITLTSGGTSACRQSEVSEAVIAKIRTGLDKGGELWGGWAVTVLKTWLEGQIFETLAEGVPMSRCWLCTDPATSDAWWDECEGLAPPSVVLHRPRGVPWLAVPMLPGALSSLDPSAMQRMLELGDADWCVAWALLP